MDLGALLAGGLLGFALRYLYDLKVQPRIERSRKLAEKFEKDREEEERRARLDQEVRWQNDFHALRDIKGFLEPLASIFKFQSTYDSAVCHRLLNVIRGRAELIRSPELQPTRDKLLKFSNKKEHISSSIESSELINIILGKYDSLQPQDLINEIDTILAGAQK